MIDIIKQTPAEYSIQSRDYQVIARLYTAIFNLSKCYIDGMQAWNSDIDNKLTTLRARTLNFRNKHNWDLDDLEAITSCFKYLIRHKGAKAAFEFCINILMRIKNIHRSNINIEMVTIENNFITFRIEENILSLGLVEDLISYILPAGMLYRIIPYKATHMDGLNSELTVVANEVSKAEVSIYPTAPEKLYIKDTNKIFDTYVYDNNIDVRGNN